MDNIYKIDVESGALTVDEALAIAEIELERAKISGLKLVKIVHGYGSKGVGGKIKIALLELLKNLKKHKKIEDFCPCEKFCFTLKTYSKYTKLYPNLLVDDNIKSLNSGATIVFL